MSKLNGLVCMVTGGSSGLGLGTVENFVRQGSRVVICDLAGSKGNEVAAKLNQQKPNSVLFSPTDVQSEADITKAIKLARDNFGSLNVLVNCAGIGVAFRTYNFNKKRAHLLEDFQKVINVNLVGTFNAIRLAAAAFAENQPSIFYQILIKFIRISLYLKIN
jgi:3-hydroxyacyl-CoA dehydrogenase/3-hydroxy-2-methylbutyryl-CoA dehydrogenase